MTPAQHKSDRPIAALLVPDILALLDEAPGDLAAETEEMHAADLANVVEALPPARVGDFLRALPASRAAQVIEYLDEELRAEFLEHVSTEQAAEIISEMTPDDRADVLETLEEKTADEILSDLPDEAREETQKLMQYEPDTAGGIMTTGFVAVKQVESVEQALMEVRLAARSGRRESMHALYVIDDDDRLVGVMSLRELVAAPDGASVADVMHTEIVSVQASADREEVARVTSEYDLVAIPVLDGFGRLVGVITVDDVIDAMVEEQTEDVQRLGAVQPLEDPYFVASFWDLVRRRVVWLVVLFIGGIFTSTAMTSYQSTIAAATFLAAFLPLIISSGGNSGSQSATLIIRGLAVGDVEISDVLRVLLREIGQGVALGACLGGIGFLLIVVATDHGALFGAAVALSLVLVVLMGTVVGSMLPLLLRRLGFDPAVASSPFVASIVDVTGIVVYFTVARRLLGIA
ncbi:MAG TPA: magnesium transporter [Gemmatimonadaceae bacterium]|nr:magnesium transporter [Gemmatimonadaceae bacterium]